MYFKYCLILFFIGFQGFAQQPTKDQIQFPFDQLIKVRETTLDSSTQALDYKTRLFYLLVNSKDNSYYATLTHLDSLQSQLKFFLFESVATKVNVVGAYFLKAEFININCEGIYSYKYFYRNGSKLKYYDSKILNDTIINNKIYGKYVIKNMKTKRGRKEKSWSYYYIIDKSKPALPFLNNNITYSVYKKNPQIPKGKLVQEVYVTQGLVVKKETFSEPIIIDKKLLIDKSCDYYKYILKMQGY